MTLAVWGIVSVLLGWRAVVPLSCQSLPIAMRRLTIAPNLVLATLWADMLTHAGITTHVQRAYASGIAGELPTLGVPGLWRDRRRAIRAVLELRHGDALSGQARIDGQRLPSR
jgi:hypothetical protein